MLFKRKNSDNWYFKFTIKGRTIYRSTGTSDKGIAQEIAAKSHAEAFDQIRMGHKPRYLWQDAVIRWLEESQNRSIETEKSHLRWLSRHLDGMYLDEINQETIELIIKAKLKETGTTRVNRTTGIISSIMNKACKKWGWIDSVPYIRKFKEDKKRIRFLTREEAARLIRELPDHTRPVAIFSLATGLRKRNVTHLEWSQVDMERRIAWVHADQSKNGKAIRVPLNDDAISVLSQQRGKHPSFVFTYNGEPIDEVNTRAFRAALKRAGIDNFRWHDLRHTWASWHVQAGTPLNALQELGGWSDHEMVLRYAHLAPEHLSEHANRLNGIVAKSVAPQ
jgi:integrase